MAKESDDDNYKEGVHFEWVPMENQSEDSDVKVRRFFNKAEREARANPKPAAPKADAPKAKPKAKPKATAPTTSPRPPKRPDADKPTSMARPEGPAKGMPGAKKKGSSAVPILAVGAAAASTGKGGPRRGATKGPYNPRFGSGKPGATGFQGKYQTGVSPRGARTSGGRGLGMISGQDPMFNAINGGGFGALEQINDEAKRLYKTGGTVKMKAGGMTKEGSAKDMREDKAMAKKHGMTMKQHEASAADKKHDAPNKMAKGGKIKMVEKGGKKVPSFAADGVGKMAMGGAVKKMNYGGGMKTGGTVRGAGAAIRGKRFTGSC
jgi:hypothetical protein